MNRQQIEAQVLTTFRESAIVTNERPIGLSEPLAKLGVADSLSLVQLVTAIEVKFQTELPDTIWMDRDGLTLDRLIEAVEKSGPIGKKPVHPVVTPKREEPTRSEAAQSKLMKVVYAMRERGLIGGTRWALARFGRFIAPRLYQRIDRVVLERDLSRVIPSHTPAVPLEIREATEADAPALSAFFATFHRKMDEDFLRHRLRHGYFCFIASHQGTLVGMTWVSTAGDRCVFTGLQLQMLPGACYAFELYERAAYGGKGVGLALLSQGLLEAKQRGFARQISWVDVSNTKMLSAAIHMFDFVKVGSIRTTRLFQMPFSKWEIAGRSGWRRTVEI